VPIWFTLTSIELAQPFLDPLGQTAGLVTKRSSPTSWHLAAQHLSVRCFQPAQSSSEQPSSIEMIG
jgi:hypothetical protein